VLGPTYRYMKDTCTAPPPCYIDRRMFRAVSRGPMVLKIHPQSMPNKYLEIVATTTTVNHVKPFETR